MRLSKLIPLAFLASACNTVAFDSDGKKTSGSKPEPVAESGSGSKDGGVSTPAKPSLEPGEDNDLALDCKTKRLELRGKAGASLPIRGKLCGLPDPRAKAEATVMFIVDVSGSMVQNDPMVGGSCGRLKAAEAIVGLLDKTNTASDGVHLGVLGFADVVAHAVDPIPLSMFRAKLNPDVFCAMRGGGTNYDAALTLALDALKGFEGPKAVYFISDGLPTRAGLIPSNSVLDGLVGAELINRIQDLGLKAAIKLRESVKQLFFYAVYLDSGTPDPNGGDPMSYLAKITGSADWVRLANRAEDLANVITSFKPPQATGAIVAEAKATAGLVAPGKTAATPVTLASFSQDKAELGTYHFETRPVKLDGKPGVTSEYELEMVLDIGDGKKTTQRVILAFTPD